MNALIAATVVRTGFDAIAAMCAVLYVRTFPGRTTQGVDFRVYF